MEDRSVVLPFAVDTSPKFAMYGVFDGHGGDAAASLAQSCLPQAIVESTLWAQGDTVGAIRAGFKKIDEMILDEAKKTGFHESGTAATVAVIRGNKLFLANVGDAMAILCRNGQALMLTTLHRAENPKEHIRVENDGGVIVRSRVHHPSWNGQMVNIEITRSLGDAYFKAYEFTKGLCSGIISEPDVCTVVLRSGDEFLLVASDGFWDVVPPSHAVTFVRNMIQHKRNLDFICKELTQMALVRGTTDNVTVLLVHFHPEPVAETTALPTESETKKRKV